MMKRILAHVLFVFIACLGNGCATETEPAPRAAQAAKHRCAVGGMGSAAARSPAAVGAERALAPAPRVLTPARNANPWHQPGETCGPVATRGRDQTGNVSLTNGST
jgi:hypothetical protein